MTRFKYPAGPIQQLKRIRGPIETPGSRLAAALAALALLGAGLIVLAQPSDNQFPKKLKTGAGATTADIEAGTEGTPSTDASGPGSVNTKTQAKALPGSKTAGSRVSVAPGGVMKLGVVIPSEDESPVGDTRQPAYEFNDLLKAMVQEINATGGFGGRTIEVVTREGGPRRGSPSEQNQAQRNTCTSLTEDHKVFMVLAHSPQGFAYDCYKSHNTPYFALGALGNEEILRKVLPLILPAPSPVIDKIGRFFPAAMEEHGFMSQKMGILILELPGYRYVADNILIPAVEARGGKVIERTYIPVSVQDAAAQSSSSVLRFQQSGVDRVILWAPGGLVWLLFARQAESQGYRPKYAITSLDQPELVATPGATQLPPEQLKGSVGAGWSPGADTIDQFYPPNEREKACWAMMNRRAGTNLSERRTSSFNGGEALALCELFYMPQAALAPAATTQLARTNVYDLFMQLGANYQPVTIPAVHFSKESVDAAKVYARIKFFEDCTCFKYVSDWLPVTTTGL